MSHPTASLESCRHSPASAETLFHAPFPSSPALVVYLPTDRGLELVARAHCWRARDGGGSAALQVPCGFV